MVANPCHRWPNSVTMGIMKQRLRQALSQRQKIHIINPERLPSAVMLPIYCKQGQYHILLTKRTERVKDHKGQISFPGGAYEERDRTLTSTALRECSEEIGLATEAVELLGELDDTITSTSPFIISPFVAAIPWPYPFKRDPIEVEEIFEAPLSALLTQDCLRQESEVASGQPATNYSYEYGGKVIWGATARILNQFLAIWASIL
ncbi:MAG: mismatch repair protein MutT [Dehalococcoidales bacterium]|nr:mismatch repair protein MutT [Dehalococcoidales bacterium]